LLLMLAFFVSIGVCVIDDAIVEARAPVVRALDQRARGHGFYSPIWS